AALVLGLAFLAPPALGMIAAGPSRVFSAWLVESWRRRAGEFQLDLGQAWGVRLVAWTAVVLGGAASAVAFLRPGRPPAENGVRLVARAGLGVLLAPAVAHVDAQTLTIQATILLVPLAAALEVLVRSARPAPRWLARAAATVLGVGLL